MSVSGDLDTARPPIEVVNFPPLSVELLLYEAEIEQRFMLAGPRRRAQLISRLNARADRLDALGGLRSFRVVDRPAENGIAAKRKQGASFLRAMAAMLARQMADDVAKG